MNGDATTFSQILLAPVSDCALGKAFEGGGERNEGAIAQGVGGELESHEVRT